MSVHRENLGAGVAPKVPHIFKVNLPVILTHVDKSAWLGKGSIYLKKSHCDSDTAVLLTPVIWWCHFTKAKDNKVYSYDQPAFLHVT